MLDTIKKDIMNSINNLDQFDYKKAEKILKWKPKITFKNLVKIMVEEDINRWEKWLKKEIQPWDAVMSGEDSNIVSKK